MWLFSRTNFVEGSFFCVCLSNNMDCPSSSFFSPLLHSNCHFPKSRKKEKRMSLEGKEEEKQKDKYHLPKPKILPPHPPLSPGGGCFSVFFFPFVASPPKGEKHISVFPFLFMWENACFGGGKRRKRNRRLISESRSYYYNAASDERKPTLPHIAILAARLFLK